MSRNPASERHEVNSLDNAKLETILLPLASLSSSPCPHRCQAKRIDELKSPEGAAYKSLGQRPKITFSIRLQAPTARNDGLVLYVASSTQFDFALSGLSTRRWFLFPRA